MAHKVTHVNASWHTTQVEKEARDVQAEVSDAVMSGIKRQAATDASTQVCM